MACLIRRAVGALAIAVLLSTTLAGVGCGGGDDGTGRAVEWYVDHATGPKSVRLSAPVEICGWEPVWLEDPLITYVEDRVYLELRHTPETGDYGGCFLGLVSLRKTVSFEQDLDELTLFDSSTDPPERRWPREALPGENLYPYRDR
jgi:hypothetical protein